MATPNSTVITKLTNGNVLVSEEGGDYTLLPQSYLTKESGRVVVRGIDIPVLNSFTPEVVQKVVRDDGTEVLISDVDTLFTELNTHFFFVSSSGLEEFFNQAVFVDSTNGNDATAVKYNISKPYDTIQAAITAAVSGDTIVVFPGSYSGTIDVKAGVDVYCFPGVTITGSIEDNSATVSMQWRGHADLDTSDNNCIDFRGANTNVLIELNDIKTTGNQGIIVNPGVSRLDFVLKCKRLEANQTIGTFRGNSHSKIIVDEQVICAQTTGDNRILDLRNGFEGSVNITANNYTFSSTTDNHEWLVYSFDTTLLPRVIVNGNKVTSTNNTDATVEENQYLIFIIHAIDLCLNNLRISTVTKSLIETSGIGSDAERILFNNVVFSSTHKKAFRLTRSFIECFFNNCQFIVGSSGSDLNIIGFFGQNNAVLADVSSGQTNNFIATFKDCQFLKESLDTDNKAMIYLDGADSKVQFIDCDIVGEGATTISACDASALADGKAYFRNTASNVDNTSNVEDTAVASGFQGSDTALTIHKRI